MQFTLITWPVMWTYVSCPNRTIFIEDSSNNHQYHGVLSVSLCVTPSLASRSYRVKNRKYQVVFSNLMSMNLSYLNVFICASYKAFVL